MAARRDGVVVGGEASRRGLAKPRETRAAKEAREAREAAQRDAEVLGQSRLARVPFSWGPDEFGRFLAGGLCQLCGAEVVGAWSLGAADGEGERRHDPHREAARRSLFLALAAHECRVVASEAVPGTESDGSGS